jgi:uncharacterized protein (DUF2062 family)
MTWKRSSWETLASIVDAGCCWWTHHRFLVAAAAAASFAVAVVPITASVHVAAAVVADLNEAAAIEPSTCSV